MKNEDYFRRGFRLNSVILATVRCIKDDRVRFIVTDVNGEECDAWYYIHGENINLHQTFKKGEIIEVSVLRIGKDSKTNDTIIDVRPLVLPIDIFIAQNTMGSEVNGKITKIFGSGMTVELAQNVCCQVKRIKGAKTGMNILCRLSRYNENRKVLFAAVI